MSEPKSVLKSFSKENKNSSGLVVYIIVILLGIGSGWFLSRNTFGQETKQASQEGASNITKTEDEAGMADESAFSNSEAPVGILQEGGINGEGNYHLERPGGPSQNVYLTSTVLDLKSFVGKKVQVWGETLSGQKAGWLMDVGKIKVVK